MKWSETISLQEPLVDVRPMEGVPGMDWAELLQQREEAAFQRGFRQAEGALTQQILEQRAEIAALQEGVLEALRSAIPKLVSDSENFLIHLAVEAAEKVVGGMPISAEIVAAVVRDALRQTERGQDITVQLHPEDLDLLQKHGTADLAQHADVGRLKFSAAPEISRGGCVLQTPFGRVDARREVKWEQLRESVRPEA